LSKKIAGTKIRTNAAKPFSKAIGMEGQLLWRDVKIDVRTKGEAQLRQSLLACQDLRCLHI